METEVVTKRYNELIEFFRNKDTSHESWVNKPFIIGDDIYSTDKYCMVWFNKNLYNGELDFPVYEKTKIGDVIPDLLNIGKRISIEELNLAISKCKTEDDYDLVGTDIICDECEGEGEVEWEYRSYCNYFKCPKCDGDGLSSKQIRRPNGKKKVSEDSLIQIGKSFFSATMVNKIIQASNFLLADCVELVAQPAKDKASLFKISDASLIAMPMLSDSTSNDNVYYVIN